MSDTYWCELAYVDRVVAESVAITVEHGRITSVVSGVQQQPRDVELRGVTVPGFANAHSHAFHRALRSRTQADRGSFWTWRELMYRAAERLDPDRYHRLARATFAEMAVAGITAVGEFHYVHHQPDGRPYADPNAMGEALLTAASDAGIRITLLDTAYLHGGLDASGYLAAQGPQVRFSDGSVDAWAERASGIATGEGQRVGAAIHSVRAVDPDSMGVVAAWTADRGAPLHAHVSEQIGENDACHERFAVSPLALLARVGAITDRFTAVHATHVTDHDIELLATADATVCMCPTTERDLGDGIGPTASFADASVAMTIGSDSHAVIDPLEEARAIELDERLRSQQRGIHCAADLLEAAIGAGHRSLGWDDAGDIAVGQRADLATVSLDSIRTAGVDVASALEAVVFAATASDITHVLADGRRVASDGAHATIDVASELRGSINALMED